MTGIAARPMLMSAVKRIYVSPRRTASANALAVWTKHGCGWLLEFDEAARLDRFSVVDSAGVVVLVCCGFSPTTAGTDACVAADSLAADAALGVCKLS